MRFNLMPGLPVTSENPRLNQLPLKTGGTAAPPLTDWLDVLQAVLPPCGVLLVGAGAGSGAWIRWLGSRSVASTSVPVHLVEGDDHQYRRLQRNLGADNGWTLWRDVVSPGAGPAVFHRASNSAESGLLPVQSLQGLWPNLAAEHELTVEDAATLDGLHAEAGKRINWLFLDCLPAAALLQGGVQLMSQLDVALVRVASGLPRALLADGEAADEVLRASGMRRVYSEAERHPALAQVLYVRDTNQRLRASEPAQEQAKRAGEMASESASRASEDAHKALQQELQHAQSRAKQAQEQLESMQEAWAQEKTAMARAQSKQWEPCEQSIKDLEKQLRASFEKGMANSVKQIEDFISIQSYLTSGDSLSNFHGWPISPDIGLFLVEHIRERRHDLIIEFGSGTSTALFAKTLKVSRPEALAGTAKAGKGASLATVRAARPVCAFEHDKLYVRKTQAMLESQGLLEWVSLNHAPLVDWEDDTGRYLYYDCDAMLAGLAKRLAGAPKRVLVLIDGPPGSTCPNARYPAVPHVFKHFARHEVDVVLDDASRPEEKAVIELWRAYWKKRSIHAIEASESSEKGLYWARNYE